MRLNDGDNEEQGKLADQLEVIMSFMSYLRGTGEGGKPLGI